MLTCRLGKMSTLLSSSNSAPHFSLINALHNKAAPHDDNNIHNDHNIHDDGKIHNDNVTYNNDCI